MDRGELEDLDRESLVVMAQASGIRRARILTRPELMDELLRIDPTSDSSQLRKSRGFFGRARDLVARAVERGLHLPDTADRIRAISTPTLSEAVPYAEPQAMPTVTLAEIYAAQGHGDRAKETLRRVLEREPEHVAARALLAQLEDEAYIAPSPPLPPEPERCRPEDEDLIPEAVSEVDTCLAIQLPPDERGGRMYVCWHVSRAPFEASQGAQLVLRAHIVTPGWDGPHSETRDVELANDARPGRGETRLETLPATAIVRVAVGRFEGATFIPLAHSPALEMTPDRLVMMWTPAGSQPVSSGSPLSRALTPALLTRALAA